MNASLQIVWEDNHILVCHKPAGVAVQTAKLGEPDMESLAKKYLAKITPGKEPYVGVVHRLDQPVEGVLVFGKEKTATASLSKQLQQTAHKQYYARVWGVLEEKEKTLVHFLEKDGKTHQAILSTPEKGKKAELTYRVIEEANPTSLLEITLHTGRFHQIRAQLSAIGHSIVGDWKYGSKECLEWSKENHFRYPALCAYQLQFRHPKTNKEMCFILKNEDLPKWCQQ